MSASSCDVVETICPTGRLYVIGIGLFSSPVSVDDCGCPIKETALLE